MEFAKEDNSKTPSSFCTICTNGCKDELVLWVLTLSIHHEKANVYIMCDSESKETIDNLTPNVNERLNIHWLVELDEYSNKTRKQMEDEKTWSDFQMKKAEVMSRALEKEEDTLFLDSDIVILDKINDVNKSMDLGVSPQYIKDENVKEVGYYNGGMLWTKNKEVPKDWIEFTKTSRYFDQASIEDLANKYSNFTFKDNYNLQTWRFVIGQEDGETIAGYMKPKNGRLYYKNKPLKCIHTHFNVSAFQQINSLFLLKLQQAKHYKELSCIYRSINRKWIMTVPSQPQPGLWHHKNDSFRELSLLQKKNNKDVDVQLNKDSGHCWLVPNVILYDRPNQTWFNNEFHKAGLVMLGNLDNDVEGMDLKKKGVNTSAWTFWPRRPYVVETMLEKEGTLEWEKRDIESIFVGNFENKVQEKYRKTDDDWESVLDVYHCTEGRKHKFSQEEYLNMLRRSKYGLCIRGYGKKCHREVECMAWGTVPIITNDVCISSYINPPKEGVHYIRAHDREDMKRKMAGVRSDRWKKMSNACVEWYKENVHSKGSWNTTIKQILYD